MSEEEKEQQAAASKVNFFRTIQARAACGRVSVRVAAPSDPSLLACVNSMDQGILHDVTWELRANKKIPPKPKVISILIIESSQTNSEIQWIRIIFPNGTLEGQRFKIQVLIITIIVIPTILLDFHLIPLRIRARQLETTT